MASRILLNKFITVPGEGRGTESAAAASVWHQGCHVQAILNKMAVLAPPHTNKVFMVISCQICESPGYR